MNTLLTVPFHNQELFIIEHNNQPYTPMKPIVEGMGLDWKSQYVKLKQRFDKGMVEITIPTNGGMQTMICLLLRKLPAWLYSIMPNKVKPELRDNIIMYQNECDDVLWDYWTKGKAINQRHTISPEQKSILHEIVDLKAGEQRALRAQIWTRHNRHFKINSYHELLSIHFNDSVRYLEEIEVKGKSTEAHIELLDADVTSQVMNYYSSLRHEILRLGGQLPDTPEFDVDTLVRATITRMIQGSRMVLNIGWDNKPNIQVIPNQSWILTEQNIAKLIGDPWGPKKELMPEIIQAAASRL